MDFIFKLLILYIIMINIAGFASMGIDKRKAIKHQYRISEATLFTIAIIGGSIGSIAGMQTFRHKTKHWYFKYGMPAILVVQVILAIIAIKAFL